MPRLAAGLAGLTLAEGFRRAVLDDPAVRGAAAILEAVPAGACLWLDVTRHADSSPRRLDPIPAMRLMSDLEPTLAVEIGSGAGFVMGGPGPPPGEAPGAPGGHECGNGARSFGAADEKLFRRGPALRRGVVDAV